MQPAETAGQGAGVMHAAVIPVLADASSRHFLISWKSEIRWGGSETLLFAICHRSFASPHGCCGCMSYLAPAPDTHAREMLPSQSDSLVASSLAAVFFVPCTRYRILPVYLYPYEKLLMRLQIQGHG